MGTYSSFHITEVTIANSNVLFNALRTRKHERKFGEYAEIQLAAWSSNSSPTRILTSPDLWEWIMSDAW